MAMKWIQLLSATTALLLVGDLCDVTSATGGLPLTCFFHVDETESDNTPFIDDATCPRKPGQIKNRKCFKKCRTDDDCRGRSKRCLCDDVCGKSCVKPSKRCQELKPIFNGNYEIIPFNTFAARARYTCNVGHVLSGSPERVCQGDGYWSGEPPDCEPENSFPGLSGECLNPPVVPFAIIDGSPAQSVYPLGTQLTYSCADGYNIDGFFRAMCVGEGRWVGPHMTCSPRRCPHPGDISNGRREGSLFIYPNRVTYVCAEGYEIVGRPFRECEAAGKWSGDLPSCRPVTCPRLPTPANGQVRGKEFLFGSEVSFTCFRGFEYVGSRARTCQQDGTWSGTDTSCELVDCGTPGPFYDGSVRVDRTTFGANAVFTCFDRTTLNGSISSACMANGRWSHPTPTCWRQCEVPHIDFGHTPEGSSGTWVENGVSLTLYCERGYELNVTGAAPVCNNGTWSYMASCAPASCNNRPPPNDIQDGIVRYHGVKHNDKARYKCHPGFRLEGDTYLTCQKGEWVGRKPICIPVYCDYPGTIKNGQVLLVGAIGKYEYRVYVRRIGHNEEIEYQCDKGFKRIGPAAATCVDGSWSPATKPYCVRGQHPKMLYVFRGKRDVESDSMISEHISRDDTD